MHTAGVPSDAVGYGESQQELFSCFKQILKHGFSGFRVNSCGIAVAVLRRDSMTCHSRPLQLHERVTCVAEAQCDKGLPADRHKPLRLEWLLLMEHHYVESSRHIVSIRTRVFFRL